MLRNFIKNIVNSSCAETHHFSDAEAPLSSILDTEDAVCHGQMPSRIRTATLEGLPDEIRCHIPGFLSYNEIIRCALTCLTLYNTVKYSVGLQYIIELGAQRLIEVHPRSPTASLAEYLCILRKKAKAWNAFKPIATDVFRGTTLFDVNSIVHGNIISSMRYMDEPQDLEIIIEFPIDVDSEGFKYRISSCTISTGEEHPLSHGSRVVSGRAACSEARYITIAVAILDDRLAVYIAGLDEETMVVFTRPKIESCDIKLPIVSADYTEKNCSRESWRSAKGPLYAILVKHNTFYYACGLLLSVVNVIVPVLPLSDSLSFFLPEGFEVFFLAILATRMHLHLWHMDHQHVHGSDIVCLVSHPDHATALTNLAWALSQSSLERITVPSHLNTRRPKHKYESGILRGSPQL
ncbi:hypothetical protein BDR03DRAFT_997831 [Suillus americanus]|nr:hypothetical protein BDR03DRAFT_997831 [Suillus americanus]